MGDFADALRRAGQWWGREPAGPPGSETAHPVDRRQSRTVARLLPRPSIGVDSPLPGDAGEEVPPADPGPVAIPRTREGSWISRAVLVEPRGPVAERYRHFSLRVLRELEREGARSVLVTSALRDEGKSTTACNLALALASIAAGRRIALIDLDLRRPEVVRGMGITPRVGIERVLSGGASLESARIRTDLPSLDLFLAREPTAQAHELLAGPELPQLLRELSDGYEAVVCDTPPVLLFPDTPLVAAHVGAWVAVARAGVTRHSTFREMLELMPRDGLIGSFLNHVRLPHRSHSYTGYYEDPPP